MFGYGYGLNRSARRRIALPKDNLLGNFKAVDGELVEQTTTTLNPTVYYPTLSDDGALFYNPQSITWILDNGHIGEAYTLTKVSDTRYEVDYSGSTTYEGGNGIPHYCLIDLENITGELSAEIKAIFDRTGASFAFDTDNTAFEYYVAYPYGVTIETLLRLPEFLNSIQDDSHLFIKVRDTDGALEQLLVYEFDSYVGVANGVDDRIYFVGAEINNISRVEFDVYVNNVLQTITSGAGLYDLNTGVFTVLYDNTDFWSGRINSIRAYDALEELVIDADINNRTGDIITNKVNANLNGILMNEDRPVSSRKLASKLATKL